MGIFGDRKSDPESEIDSFLEQKILLPQTFLRPNVGEDHIRIYGDSRFSLVRQALLNDSSLNGEPFWHGKVFLICRDTQDDRPVPSIAFEVMFEGKLIGLISEFDSVARQVLKFEIGQQYVARAVIRADLIGNLVHLFVNPENTL